MIRSFCVAACLALVLVGCGGTPAANVTPDQVVAALKGAGVEAETPTKMTKDDYGMAPMVCDGQRFLTPSLGADAGGRAFVCGNTEDLTKLKTFYDELGKSSAAFFSWTFAKGNVLVQLNGDMPEAQAKKYEAAVQALP